jgi:CubicO group peptidase (beta-lactamase class C family)
MQMNTFIRAGVRLAAAAGLVAGLFANPAAAQDWKPQGQFGWFAVGKVIELQKGHYFWTGEFSGTFFSDKGPGGVMHGAGVKCPGWNDANIAAAKGKAAGYCIVSDADGDIAWLSWSVEGDTRASKGTFEWTGGTGKYKDIKGSNTVATQFTGNWADGTASGLAVWNRK